MRGNLHGHKINHKIAFFWNFLPVNSLILKIFEVISQSLIFLANFIRIRNFINSKGGVFIKIINSMDNV